MILTNLYAGDIALQLTKITVGRNYLSGLLSATELPHSQSESRKREGGNVW